MALVLLLKTIARLGGENSHLCAVHTVAVCADALQMAAGLYLNGYKEKAPVKKIHGKCRLTVLEGNGLRTLSC